MYQYQACYPVIAPIASDTSSGITYRTGLVLGQFMNASKKYNVAEASLYGDDKRVDYAREITGLDLSLSVTWLPGAANGMLFGQTAPTSANRRTDTATTSPNVGVGYVKKGKRTGSGSNEIVYTACWFYKVCFGLPDDAVQTKSGNIQFNTPTLNGAASFTEAGWLEEEWEYSTLEAAIGKINEMANLGQTYVAAPVISPSGDAVYTGSVSVTMTCATTGATIYYTDDGTAPTSESDEYTTAITVDESTIIKAVAIKSGKSSEVTTVIFAVNAE